MQCKIEETTSQGIRIALAMVSNDIHKNMLASMSIDSKTQFKILRVLNSKTIVIRMDKISNFIVITVHIRQIEKVNII